MTRWTFFKRGFAALALTAAALQPAFADEDKAAAKDLPIPAALNVVTKHKGTFGGVKLDYSAVVSDLQLKNEAGDVYADAVTTAYIADKGGENRPVTFVFNGGPGSASVWLHMGLMGPKRVVVPSDADDAGNAPYKLVDNDAAMLDVTDVVFIDPIGTGYSRLAGKGKPEDVYGLEEDAESVAQIIREWVRAHNRWNSPKYVLGESFGTTRAAAILPYLQDGPEPIRMNGLILISQALDYTGSTPSRDNLVGYVTYLPTMAATAWYHGKIDHKGRTLEDFLTDVRAFATDEYLPALFKGSSLPAADFDRIAAKLAAFTGLDVAYVKRANLRILADRFEKELLRDKGLSVGRLDARYTTDEVDHTDVAPHYDAADAAISGAFSAAFHHYMRNDLGVDVARPYYVSGPEVGANWVWMRPKGNGYYEPEYVNTAPELADAMRRNPALKVMLASGYFDFATPFFDGEYTFHRHGIDMSRVSAHYYKSGHMVYLNADARAAVAHDIRAFLTGK